MKELPLKPMYSQLLLAKIKTNEISEGGIYLPESVRKPVNQGRIVAMGPDVPRRHEDNMGFAVDDMVVFPIYVDHTIEMNRETYSIISCDQVILNDFGFYANQKAQENREG